MGEPTIRRATPADAAGLTAVYHDAYRENRELGFPAKAESVPRRTVADWIHSSRVYVAVAGRRVVGGVRLEVTDPDRLKLSRLAVRRDRQGEGIASALLDRAERAARDAGCGVIWLTTPPEHPFLPAIYRGRGYEQTDTYPLEYRDYDEIVMERRLE